MLVSTVVVLLLAFAYISAVSAYRPDSDSAPRLFTFFIASFVCAFTSFVGFGLGVLAYFLEPRANMLFAALGVVFNGLPLLLGLLVLLSWIF